MKMEVNNHCSICIRECEIGKSFCHRRDGRGKLIQPYRFNNILIDSLFDKPIRNYGENTRILSVGSWGCNLRCLGCQNVNLSWAIKGCCLGYEELNPHQLVELAVKNDCRGICFTYNEPAILLEAIEKYSIAAKENGLFTVFVTNSTLTERSTRRLAKCIDVVAADIKSTTDDFYYKYCGAAGIDHVAAKILNCIRTFYESGIHVEVRTNIIPGGNDQTDNYYHISSWIKNYMGVDTPWHITRFFPANQLNNIPSTSTAEIEKAKQTGMKTGLKYVYTHSDKGCDCAKDYQLFNIGSKNNADSSCCSKEKVKLNFTDITFR